MASCTRCGWSAPIGATTCQRCGQSLAAPQPTPPPHPTLILRLQSPTLPDESWEVTDRTLGIGRLDNADVSIPDKSVSRQHARILPTPGGFEIEDVGSVNGTWLNDQQISDRTPLANGDRLMIGDVPLVVELRQPAAPVAPPPPPPLPPPVGGPSTVFYDLDEALAAATPATRVDEATLVGDEPTVEPAPPATPPPPPARPPSTIVEPMTPPSRPSDFVPAFEPRPAPPCDVTPPPASGTRHRPTPPPPTFEPRPVPARDPTEPPPATFDPRPAPRDLTPAPTRFEPRPVLPQDVTPPPPPAAASPPPPAERSATDLIQLADQLATALRLFKGDARLALWLFERAGGQAAAQAFVEQVQRLQRNPDDPREQDRLQELAPTAASLLQAAVMLANLVSSLGTQTPAEQEAQANASDLHPVARP